MQLFSKCRMPAVRFHSMYKTVIVSCLVLMGFVSAALAQTDLAQGKPATSSGVEGVYVAANAVDGNSTTRWSSTFADNQWLQVDLGASFLVTKVILMWEAASGKNYRVEVSADGTIWDTLVRKTNMPNGARSDTVTGSKTGRYVRMFGETRTTGYGFSLFDFKVYGSVSLATAVTGSGSIVLNPAGGSYAVGTNVTCTATPQTGWQFSNWSGDLSGAVNPQTVAMTGNKSIIAVFTSIGGSVITASAGTGGSITPSGSVTVPNGGSQTFAITPATGYQIASVLVDGGSVGAVASYVFTNVSANHTIAAAFTPITHVITASAGTGGSITPSGAVTVAHGGSLTFAITPATGYQIASVLVDGASVGAVASYVFSSVTANHTIAASFSAITYAITASAGTGGSITPSGAVSVAFGGSQTFTITAAPGYQIASVLVDGASVGTVSTYTFTNVTANHTIAASFSVMQYTITASAQTGGSISPSGAVPVAYGGSRTFTIAANTGYQISNVLVDGASVGAVTSYTFSNVTANHTIALQVTALTFNLSVINSGNGSTIPSGSLGVQAGVATTISATPDAGYVFTVWSVIAGSATIANPSSPTTQVTLSSNNATVSAAFAPGTPAAPTCRQLSISGTLTDASGNALGSGTPVVVDATVRLFATATSGTEVYSETFWSAQGKGVTVDKGLFVVRLGTGTTGYNLQSVLSANADLYVEITIEGATPDVLLPRTPLTAAAYSLVTPPAAAVAPVTLHGSSDPNSTSVEGAIGAYYVDDASHLTWVRVTTGWKLID